MRAVSTSPRRSDLPERVSRTIAPDAMTGDEFLADLFEFELCDECMGDAEDHDAVEFMGNWFARCRATRDGSSLLTSYASWVIDRYMSNA
jgi:hypothetical protein